MELRPIRSKRDQAEALKRAEALWDAREGTPGTLKQRTQSGRRYWVREYIRVDGSKVDDYLGADTAMQKSRLEQTRAEIELARALAAGSAQLRLFGYQRMERKPAAVLEEDMPGRLLEAFRRMPASGKPSTRRGAKAAAQRLAAAHAQAEDVLRRIAA